MKYIIALIEGSKKGKTSVGTNVWNRLIAGINNDLVRFDNSKYDVIGYVSPSSLNNKKIGVNTPGDNPADIAYGLIKLLDADCEIIFCTAHSKSTLFKTLGLIKVGNPPQPRNIKNIPQEITAASKAICNYRLITSTHFVDNETVGVALSKGGSKILKINGFDINEVSAENIYQLMRKL